MKRRIFIDKIWKRMCRGKCMDMICVKEENKIEKYSC